MAAKKVGSVVLATDQGLGYLAKDFFDNGVVHEVLVRTHSSRTNHFDWYPSACKSEEEFLGKIDILLLFETAFDWKIIPRARARGIKTVLMPMYECTQHPLPYQPDLIISPSLLDQQYYPESALLTVPVNVPWRLRERAHVFVHNAGNGGLGGRNGTRELVEAMNYVKSPLKLIIRSQKPLAIPLGEKIDYRFGNFENIWDEGDVFVFPEKFNGLSLPLQEAYASGMLVMCGNRFPMNTWLPNEPLIPVQGYKKERIAVEFDSATISPEIIAKTLDEWYDKDITAYSVKGREWAEQNSWSKLKEVYENVLSSL